jgi:hypothetical protein
LRLTLCSIASASVMPKTSELATSTTRTTATKPAALAHQPQALSSPEAAAIAQIANPAAMTLAGVEGAFDMD